MISSKWIKILCYITMTCICLVSILLIVFGIKGAVDDNTFSVVWIILGLILPLIVSVSMYPIFALANIDENIVQINKKLDNRASVSTQNNVIHEQPQSHETIIESDEAFSNNEPIHEEAPVQKTIQTDKFKDAIDFINRKYDIQIDINDSLDTIKLKIADISEKSSSANILINKILNANDKETIVSAFILHKSAHS